MTEHTPSPEFRPARPVAGVLAVAIAAPAMTSAMSSSGASSGEGNQTENSYRYPNGLPNLRDTASLPPADALGMPFRDRSPAGPPLPGTPDTGDPQTFVRACEAAHGRLSW